MAIGLVDGHGASYEDEPLIQMRQAFRANLAKVNSTSRRLLDVVERCEELEARLGRSSKLV
jgi:hypothetical protein